jgi:oxygen-independent coproporphyrinogen-3 oxidase
MPGLYVHVPFCVRKCSYCDFYSLAQPPDRAAPDAARYLAALEVELASLPPGFVPETIFFGGGTPTELATADLSRLLAMVRRRVDPGRVREWTCESNPGTLTPEKAELLRASGVNRVSLGVQSFDPENLRFLGRIHTAEEAVAGFRLLRACGFGNVNLDLIFGIPGSSQETLRRDLETLAALGPEHASCYCLIFEEGTPLARMRAQGLVREVAEEDELAQYALAREVLARAGYRHYEISNFARPGRECRHNLLYWGAGEYVGVGPSAHSHWGGARWGNVKSLVLWTERLLAGRPARDFEERLEPEARAREALVMGLRRTDGVERAAFRAETGFDYAALRGREIERLAGLGLLEEAGGRLRLTERGLFVSDAVFAELV